jgi:Surfeit locus protein 6
LEQEEANMDDDDDDDSDDEAENQAPETKKGKKKKKKTPPGKPSDKTAQVAPDTTTPASTPTNVSRIDALREKLHAKLAEKRGQRPLDPTTISKRASRRAEKLKRKEEALKKSATTKVKDAKKAFVLTSPNAAVAPKEDLKSLDFGKLAGLNKAPESFQNNKSLKNLNKKKNLELMLQKAEEKRDRLEQLKQGTEEDKKKAANMMWGEALKEASGDRIKDDPAKLKKALKRKVTQKEKSQKAWKSRMEQTKEKMEERLAIRTHNLNKRKEGGAAGANLSSKKIKDDAKDGEEKKSRKMSRAGFEGKKQEFLNNKKKNGSTTPIKTTQ